MTCTRSDTAAGDYFTALELGSALARKFGWEIRYIPMGSAWYDGDGIDVLVAMRDDFDASRVQSNNDTIKVAWVRNWFDRWIQRPGFPSFDVVLGSSQYGADFIAGRTGKPVSVLRIATNPMRFQLRPAVEAYRSDFVFTGSHWGAPREISELLQPGRIDAQGAIYGRGWEKNETLSSIYRGFVPYARIPDVYASTHVVLDDANHATKPYASVNSRVFDALACGRVVLSNGQAGVREVFGELLPTYSSAEELQHQLTRFLRSQTEREQLADRLRNIVLSEHTYDHRAVEFLETILPHMDAPVLPVTVDPHTTRMIRPAA